MLIHNIFPVLCVKNINLNDNILQCSMCGKYIGHIYEGSIYLHREFKKYRSKIKNSGLIEEYSKIRMRMDAVQDREWRDFLRNLKFDEDEVFSMETTDEWVPESSDRGNPVGC